jgi:predicted AlkP superfamily pyrophosphatase or phosphodiesterase
MKGWIRDYPDDRYLQRFAWFEAIRDDDTISEKDALAAIDAYVQSVRDYKEPGFYYIYFPIVADYLLKHGWEPGRALELLKESQSPIEQYREQLFSNDNQSDEDVKKTHDWQIQMD